ncbi:hypothetical protein NPIL_170851 [Nephila pilipes]|uniref:Uncharacterized protein n=1 Tax=Nephila pilipes TaxID=299642 RepID=A0A8X6PW28_NEPPI|nr:hypothetical protein NPIL_170851 [Nephila pilipes]
MRWPFEWNTLTFKERINIGLVKVQFNGNAVVGTVRIHLQLCRFHFEGCHSGEYERSTIKVLFPVTGKVYPWISLSDSESFCWTKVFADSSQWLELYSEMAAMKGQELAQFTYRCSCCAAYGKKQQKIAYSKEYIDFSVHHFSTKWKFFQLCIVFV